MTLANPSADAVYIEDVEVLGETPKAVRVQLDGESRWIPRSVLHEDSEVEHVGDAGRLALKRWWCEQNGLAE